MSDEIKLDTKGSPEQEDGGSKPIPPLPTVNLEAEIIETKKEFAILKNTVSFVTDTNRFILIILFLALIGFLASVILGVIQTTNTNTSTQIELIKSMEGLKYEVNSLNIRLYQATSSGVIK